MKYILLLSMLWICDCKAQNLSIHTDGIITHGFIFANGIKWTETPKQDSVLEIIIEGDTMTAIRNLLLYCLQEKEENDNASVIIKMLNVDYLSTLIESKEFDFYLKEYKKAVAKNNLKRGIKTKKKK